MDLNSTPRTKTSSIKLPLIHTPRNFESSINSTVMISAYPDSKKFNQNIESLLEKLNANETYETELNEIKNLLIKAIVNTLTIDSDQEWKNLAEYFEILKPLPNIFKNFENDKRLNHYFERIYFHTNRSLHRQQCADALSLLDEMFPRTLDYIKKNSITRSFASKNPEKPEKQSIDLVPEACIDFYKDKLNPYKNKIKEVKFNTNYEPTFSEINQTISQITLEKFNIESYWKKKDSAIKLVASLNLDELKEDEDTNKSRTSRKSKVLKRGELFKSFDDRSAHMDSTFELNYIPQHYSADPPDFDEKCLNLNGREMVFYLLESSHLGNAVSFYLNNVESKVYRPYDLVTVAKSHRNLDNHYIFSVFGVLNVVAGEENEKFSLDEWNRFAVLWEACSKIKFFKTFLHLKFLRRWKQNAKFSKFIKLRKSIKKDIIIAIPEYSEPLIQISRLIQEIFDMRFLFKEEVKVELENESNNTLRILQRAREKKSSAQIQMQEKLNTTVYTFVSKSMEITFKSCLSLDYFFVYVKYILTHTRAKFFEKLKFYQRLVNQVASDNINKSMSSQQAQKIEREKELANINHKIGLMGNFVNLVSVLLGENLLIIAQNEIDRFLIKISECNESKRDPMFSVELGFSSENLLTMVPSKEKFINDVMMSLKNIKRSIISSSEILDYEGILKDFEKYGFNLIDYKMTLEKLELEDDDDIDQDIKKSLEDKKSEFFYHKMINSKPPVDTMVTKPLLNTKKDFDENLIEKKLLIQHEEELLKVTTFSIKAQSNPLKPISFNSIINNDDKLNKMIAKIKTIIEEETSEVEKQCVEYSWTNEITSYISSWSPKQVLKWKAVAAYEIEDQLNKIRQWIENIRSNIEKAIITKQKLIKIDTSPVENDLVPKLEAIYNEICECLVKETNKDILSFISLIQKNLKELKKKPESIEDFAKFAKSVSKYKEKISTYETKVSSIKSLLEVIRVNYRSLSNDEELLDSQAQDLWKSFLSKLQESIEFVNTQSPNILEQLDGLYNKYVEELRKIHQTGTSGIYLDPYQNTAKILGDLKNLCEDFSAVEIILNQCVLWNELITEKFIDISFVKKLSEQLVIRKDLWKYYEVTSQQVKDWKNTSIKKLNIKKIEEKISYWDMKVQEFKKSINEDDKVLVTWQSILESFKFNLRWINKLSSPTFKKEEFEQLFSAIGIVYDAEKAYTIQDLIDLKMEEYLDLINAIYKKSYSQSNHMQKFDSIKELWTNKLKFKLAKNFPIKIYQSENFSLASAAAASTSTSLDIVSTAKLRELRDLSSKQMEETSFLMTNVTYKLIDLDEIRYNLEDSLIKLNLILQSPVGEKTKESVIEFELRLNQIWVLSELWLKVQEKWLYLERIFFETNLHLRPNQDFITFETIVADFKSFQVKMNLEPNVNNILRDESYKTKLEEWDQKFTKLCVQFDNQLEITCSEFPRFYFLEKDQLIETSCHLRDCRKYMKSVGRCFPGVIDLVYEMPEVHDKSFKDNSVAGSAITKSSYTLTSNNSKNKNTTRLNFDVNSSNLEITGLIGSYGSEKLNFYVPYKSYSLQRVSEWFDGLLRITKSSMCKLVNDYLEQLDSFKNYSYLPTLDKRISTVNDSPAQVVILGEAIYWCQHVEKIIEDKKFEQFNFILNYLNNSISQFSSLQMNPCETSTRELYSKLIIWMLFIRDVTSSLSKVKNLSELSYEWLRTLKYRCEKVTIENDSDSLNSKRNEEFYKYENFCVYQMTSVIDYDFEFIDSTGQMIITPLTEKCFLSLTSALSSVRCGTLTGTESTGKSQTICSLAKACGQHAQVINCNTHLTVDATDRYLKGLASSGSWILFDKIENLSSSILSRISLDLDYLNSSIRNMKNLVTKEEHELNDINKNIEQSTKDRAFINSASTTKSFLNQSRDELTSRIQSVTKFPFTKVKFKDEELQRIDTANKLRNSKIESYYKRKWLGYIKFKDLNIRVSANYGCFVTTSCYKNLPETLKDDLRVFNIIEPDYKQITTALLTSFGLNQGLANVEVIAQKILDFLEQLANTIQNELTKNCKTISFIKKLIKITSIRYSRDKGGRQERALCQVLAFLFGSSFRNDNEKKIFHSLLKKIFEFDASSFMEELLSNVIKNQLDEDKLILNHKQLQKMIDLYVGLKVNQFAVLCGPQLDGKTTVWKAVSRAINLFDPANEISQNQSKTTQIFKKYSMLVNLFGDEFSFPKISATHLFPQVYTNSELNEKLKDNLFVQEIKKFERSNESIINLKKEDTGSTKNRKHDYNEVEKWLILDETNVSNTLLMEQIILFKEKLNCSVASSPNLPENCKFIIETSNLNNVSPAIVNKTLLILQQDLKWSDILETKLNEICFKFSVPKSKNSILQEYSRRFFADFFVNENKNNFRSILHGNLKFSQMNPLNFVLAYSNIVDCLINKHQNLLKKSNDEEETSNWKSLLPISAYAFFWSIANYLTSDEDLNEFNNLAMDLIVKNKCTLNSIKSLYHSEVDINTNSLKPIQRILMTSQKDWIINDYQHYAVFIKMFIENSKPCLVYGDIGIGKSTLIEKLLTNKYDFIRMANIEPHGHLHDAFQKHLPFCRSKKNTSITGNKYDFIYFVDDLNLNYSCKSSKTTNLEFIRQLMETKNTYCDDEKSFIPINGINFLFTSTYPTKSFNFVPLSQSITKDVVSVHLNAQPIKLIRSIYSAPIEHWLEEFPADSVQYPKEMAQSIIKTLGEVYMTIKEILKATPAKPHYLFNFKDLSRVVQGIQLLASKSKVIPIKLSKKLQQDQAIVQVATIIKLFCHELMRVFSDRLIDSNDDKLLRSIIITSVTKNFCMPKDQQNENILSKYQLESSSIDNLLDSLEPSKHQKKAVTFKTGLVVERDKANDGYEGVLISKEHLGLMNGEALNSIIFSKYIIKQGTHKSQQGLNEKSTYIQSNLTDLMNASTSSLDAYEANKSTRMSFFFHEDAIKHLSRLTRVFSMGHGHALLASQHTGLGRTNLVRLCSFLAKMKYYEARIFNDEKKSEDCLRSLLRQCCLVAGIKGTQCIVYVKTEFHSHQILEDLCIFAKTGIYPNLFSEAELWSISNEITPAVPSNKRVERTQFTYNNFTNLIQERVHIVISLECYMSTNVLTNLFKQHSMLFTEFYIDLYKPLKPEIVNSIARYYLALQSEEAKVRKLNKKYNNFNKMSNDDLDDYYYNTNDEDGLKLNEIQTFSSIMSDFHLIASDHYLKNFILNRNQKLTFMPKPFNVSIFKQASFYLKIYMRRIKDSEILKKEKFEKIFVKINQVSEKLKNIDNERIELSNKLKSLEEVLSDWDDKIGKQKEIYRIAIDECRKEEKLVDEMNTALAKLKSDLNSQTSDIKNLLNPQYEMALKAISSIDAAQLNELKSYRCPPQRVLAVVNTLCLMFRKPPGWESGKLLLLRKGFFDDLVYYDKKNMPDDIFEALSQICAVETFTPECVKPGSIVAASFCEWIIAIYNFAKYERTLGSKTSDLVAFEKLFNERLAFLGEKKLDSENKCKVLEELCNSRLQVLKEMKKTRTELEKTKENEYKAEKLLNLLDKDNVTWHGQYDKTLAYLKTYKIDALIASCFICYAGIFDAKNRDALMDKWLKHLKKLETSTKQSIKFAGVEETSSTTSNKFSIRENFNIKSILINSNENKDLMMELNKISIKDEFFISNSLILREFCLLPSSQHWPVIYDPENFTIKVMTLLQESINSIKNSLINEYSHSSPAMTAVGLLNNNMNGNNFENDFESTLAEHASASPSANLNNADFANNESGIPTYPHSLSSSRLSQHSSSYNNPKNNASRMSGRASSIWETSTFYSRTQTAATFYQSKSGKQFMASLNPDSNINNESEIKLPVIETDLNVLPKDNLCILDSHDKDLDYKLINAAVHGVAVYLKNSQRFPIQNRLVEILLERDFLYDSTNNKEYVKIGDEDIIINPSFKLILQISTPITVNYGKSNNNLFNRLIQSNGSHFIVDFAPSVNYVKNDLLTYILDRERSGYLNQILFADKILFKVNSDLHIRQEEIIERIALMEKSILDDKTMIDYLEDKTNKLKEYNDALSESSHIEKTLNEATKDYFKMTNNISSLFEAFNMIQTCVQPSYFVKWRILKDYFLNQIGPIFKDKKTGVGASRAKQIETSCIIIFLNYFSTLLTSRHFKLLLFLHSMILIAKTQAEEKVKTSRRKPVEYNLNLFQLICESVKQNDLQYLTEINEKIGKPHYINLNSWANLCNIEMNSIKSNGSFKNLTKSLVDNSEKWIEYFQIDQETDESTSVNFLDSKDVDLLNESPLNNSLEIHEKLILWLCIRPDMINEIFTKFSIYNYGGLISGRIELDIKRAYDISNQSSSIIILLPENDNAFFNPKNQIFDFAKQVNKKLNVKVFSFENKSKNAINKDNEELRDLANKGGWAIIENAHLLKDWSKETLKLIYHIKDMSSLAADDNELLQEYTLNISQETKNREDTNLETENTNDNFSQTFLKHLESLHVHDNFRLWFIIDSDKISTLPESIMFDSIKLTAQMSDLKQTYETCKQIDRKLVNNDLNDEFIEEASTLHSLMTHEDFRNQNFWHYKEFITYVKSVGDLNNLISSSIDKEFSFDEICKNILNDMVYSCTIGNHVDLAFAKKIINQFSMEKKYDASQFIENSNKFFSIACSQNESRILRNELQSIIERQIENSNSDSNRSLFDFTNDYVNNMKGLVSRLEEIIKKIEELLLSLNVSDLNSIVYIHELNDYAHLFANVKEMLVDLTQSSKGHKIVELKTSTFYKLINNYQTKNNLTFFQAFELVVLNSNALCDLILLELEKQPKEMDQQIQISSENEMVSSNEASAEKSTSPAKQTLQETFQISLQTINLEIFYDTERILSKVLYEKYAMAKAKEALIRKQSTTTPVASPSSNNNLNTLENSKNNFRVFILEVLDYDTDYLNLKVEQNSEFILLENVYIANANYEIMSQSFQSTVNKTLSRIDLVKLTPLLNEKKKSVDTYKCVPFVNSETNKLICMFCIKFWHNNQSSLSSTQTSKSGDAACSSNNQDDDESTLIPIYKPIYFCINKSTQSLIKILKEHCLIRQ